MEIKAYAKINLTLEVLGRRPDGYHEVRTVLQSIDLADRLHFTPAPRLEMECSTPELGVEDNLVWKAADALRTATSYDKGVKIRLKKHVPIGMALVVGAAMRLPPSKPSTASGGWAWAMWSCGLSLHPWVPMSPSSSRAARPLAKGEAR